LPAISNVASDHTFIILVVWFVFIVCGFLFGELIVGLAKLGWFMV